MCGSAADDFSLFPPAISRLSSHIAPLPSFISDLPSPVLHLSISQPNRL